MNNNKFNKQTFKQKSYNNKIFKQCLCSLIPLTSEMQTDFYWLLFFWEENCFNAYQ